MKAYTIIENIKNIYSNDKIVRTNDTLLLGPGNIPKAKHMLFKPLTEEFINEYLVAEYKNILPNEYLNFLKYSNGGMFYMFKIKTERIEYASSSVTIFGIPRTPPFNRSSDMEEPFDIRVEDLRRHKMISKDWLAVGRFRKNNLDNNKLGYECSLFIDCKTERVYCVKLDESDVMNEWNSFDTCLCELLREASLYKEVYFK